MSRQRSGHIVIESPVGRAPRVRRYPARDASEWDVSLHTARRRRQPISPVRNFAVALSTFAGIGIALQLALLLIGSGSLNDLAELVIGIWAVIWSPAGVALAMIGGFWLLDRAGEPRVRNSR